MFLSFLVLVGSLQVIIQAIGQEISVVRHLDGDIFTVKNLCASACKDVSSATAKSYKRQSSTQSDALSSSVNTTCVCQCNSGLPLFREDLHICVSDLHECKVTGFLSNSGNIEKIPYVFLPQRGQIIYPQAEIQFLDVTNPVCGIAGAQQLGKSGWTEFRNLSSTELPFRLFKDESKTFLQWTGESELRETAEGKLVLVRLVCRDASPNSTVPGVFTPCVAFRIAGSPSKSNIREVTFLSTTQAHSGLSTIEYTAIGISSLLLALIYIASVSLYLHSRRSKQKPADVEAKVTCNPVAGPRDGPSLVKNNPLLTASRHFDTDSNSIHSSESDQADEYSNVHTDNRAQQQGFTSAIIHPHAVAYVEESEGVFGSSIIAERLPEEDVRIVETIETVHQQDMPMLPGAQRRKLYFNPAYFDRQLLLAPPPAAIEFLLKIREVIAIAKHKLCAKRFVPALSGIPEEETASERDTTSNKRANSLQSSLTKSKKSQSQCTGCPGCLESRNQSFPSALIDNSGQIAGESRVRAWLEDIKPPERRWREPEDNQKIFEENVRTFARSLDQLKDGKTNLLRCEQASSLTGKPLASWKDNPPMLRTFQNIARSEILDDDECQSMSKRSTKSMFENTNYDRFCRTKRSNLQQSNLRSDDTINAKVRKAIENSFIKQMEENAALENHLRNNTNEQRFSPDGSSEKTNLESLNSTQKSGNSTEKRSKTRETSEKSKELPDMIPELPAAKLQAKKIMDAVIREMVDVKALEHHAKQLSDIDYEVDSLERINRARQLNENQVSSISENVKKHSDNDSEEKILLRNYYNKLPELVSQRSEGYSLVSEVYVNDGYASPANSDDSGPEICYKPEQPGHLTIKVQDSPENYVKQDESEYEPDTLDRKPMKLKINGDVIYEKNQSSESYVDSLERPTQILLKSKGSFRDDESEKKLFARECSSLREIYEARLRSNVDSNLIGNTGSLKSLNHSSWKSDKKYLTPEIRHAKRQRKQNQPDVVPLPTSLDSIYQQPNSANKSLDGFIYSQKNARDRRLAEAGNPTASQGPSVQLQHCVGAKICGDSSMQCLAGRKVEDSGYLSSTESADSSNNQLGHSNYKKKELFKYEFASVSETDETESICDGASESGAESVGTDSVFFGNFRKLSNDNDVDNNRVENSSFVKYGFETERQTSFNASDSENESFVTVLPQTITKCTNSKR